jgi:hypothetical protein
VARKLLWASLALVPITVLVDYAFHASEVTLFVLAGLSLVPLAWVIGDSTEHVSEHKVGPVTVTGDGPLVVREKAHAAAPMTLEQALYEMELVGHDFYLFVDKESQKPSVVYRRRGYDYGVISLEMD